MLGGVVMIGRIISAVVGLIIALIGLRFLFRLLGANPANGFVNFIYDVTTPLVAPFAGIFGQSATVVGDGAVVRSVFDWTALVALIVYGILGAVLMAALRRPRTA